MTKDEVVRKIKALLAIADDGCNDNECQTALLLARQLMSKYEVSVSEVTVHDDPVTVSGESTGIEFNTRYTMWKLALARMMKNYHRCEMLITSYHMRKNKVVVFVGEGEDAKILSSIYQIVVHYLEQKIWSMHNDLWMCKASTRYFKSDSYVKGFIAGLQDQYEEQNKKDVGMALMVVTPESVVNYLEKFEKGSFTSSQPNLGVDSAEYLTGYDDGRRFQDTKLLED